MADDENPKATSAFSVKTSQWSVQTTPDDKIEATFAYPLLHADTIVLDENQARALSKALSMAQQCVTARKRGW